MPLNYLVIALLAAALLYFLFSLFRRHEPPSEAETPVAAPSAQAAPAAPPAVKAEAKESLLSEGLQVEGREPLDRAGLEVEVLWRLEHVLRGMQTPVSQVVQVDFSRDPREVALALASNPLYAARILKTVNSAAFGLSRRIDSLPRAITYLGYNQVKNIVFQSMARDNLGAAEAAAGFDPKAFWRHSHCVSVAAEHILRELDIPSTAAGAITTAALLHDIGWVVFEKFDPRAAAELFSRLGRAGEETDTLALEREAFGFDHPLAGSLLAEQWNIPEAVCRLIGLHHADSCGLPGGLDRGSAFGAAVIALAERLAALYGQPHPLAEPVLERVDLSLVLGPRARSIGVSSRLRTELERTLKFIEEFSRIS